MNLNPLHKHFTYLTKLNIETYNFEMSCAGDHFFYCWDLPFLAYSCLIRLLMSLLVFYGFSKLLCDSLLKHHSNQCASRDSITYTMSVLGRSLGVASVT